jgi:hypothetical protein
LPEPPPLLLLLVRATAVPEPPLAFLPPVLLLPVAFLAILSLL